MNFSLLNTLEQFDQIATSWNELLAQNAINTPFLRHEYLRAWWSTLGGGEWEKGELAIIAAHRDNELVGLAPFFLTHLHNLPALMLLGGIEISDYLDLIALPDDLPEFISGLFEFLSTSAELPAWNALDMFNLPDNSPSLSLLQSEAEKRGWGYTQNKFRPAVYAPLTGDFETYLAGIDKKQRHEIRRKIRRAESNERNVRWYIVTDESTLDEEAEACCRLMAQDPAKQEFLTQTMRTQMKTMIHAAFKAGILQLAFLEVDGQKAAGYLNFDYAGRIWVYNSGLDQQFRELSPGWVLLGYLLQWANENRRREFDFMRGDEDYKFKFGGIQRWVMKVKIER